MKLSEVIEKYGDCEVSEELLVMIEPKCEWKPEIGDKYWGIDCYGDVVSHYWDNHYYDRFRLTKRNVYRTEEEAQFALDMYNFCKERSFEPDWEDDSQCKYYLYLYYRNKEVNFNYTDSFNHCYPFYYPSKEAVQEIIDKYSFDELATYYGRV